MRRRSRSPARPGASARPWPNTIWRGRRRRRVRPDTVGRVAPAGTPTAVSTSPSRTRVDQLFDELRERFETLDVLINNAGVASMNAIALTPVEIARRVMEHEPARPVQLHPRGGAPDAHRPARAHRQHHARSPCRCGSRARRSTRRRRARSRRSPGSPRASSARSGSRATPSARRPIRTGLIAGVPTRRSKRSFNAQAVRRWAATDRRRQCRRLLSPAGEQHGHRPGHLPGRRRADGSTGCSIAWSRPRTRVGAGLRRAKLTTYRELLDRVAALAREPARRAASSAGCVSIEGEYGVESIAVFLAATQAGNILVPIATASRAHLDEFLELAEVECRISRLERHAGRCRRPAAPRRTSTMTALRDARAPGWCCSRRARPASTRRRCTTSAPCSRSSPCRVTAIGRSSSCSSITSAASTRLFYTLANGGAVVVSEGRMPRTGVRRHRAASRRAAADLADVPEPAAAVGGAPAPRPVVAAG